MKWDSILLIFCAILAIFIHTLIYMKQETLSQKRLYLSKASVITITISVLVVFGISLFVTYRIASPPMEYGPGHPYYAEYAGLFYNVKCSYTKANFTEYDILDELYYLGIPKDRARELFTEARENLEGPIEDGSPLKRCYQETLEYYNTALQVLDDVDTITSRKNREASERLRMENSKE